MAILAGERLLDVRVMGPNGHRVWQVQKTLQTGFAHGSAGIGCALTRLFRMSGDRRFLDAAIEGARFEDDCFDETSGNWLVAANVQQQHLRWCHGAPGIGLARLEMLDVAADGWIGRDIERALDATAAGPLLSVDHACCGNFGRVAFLADAAFRLNQPRRRLEADHLTATIVNRASRIGYGIGNEGIYAPSFHQGMSGVGYQLLRLSEPRAFPSILLWV
jgi:lantibiotic modifying enzyme